MNENIDISHTDREKNNERAIMKSIIVATLITFTNFVCIVSVFADDNIIGLPTPIDATRPGAVMLHGGGRVTDAAFQRFIELAGGRNARIVFVPSAGFSRSAYRSDREFKAAVTSRYSAWAHLKTTGQIADFRILHSDNNTDCYNPQFCEPLARATGVWFSGGAQSRLNYRYVNFPKPNTFQIALRNVIERGGIVGGTSAGMAAAPEIMTVMDYRVSATAPADAYVVHGFGLFNRAIVEQHFDARSGRLERFTSLLKDNERLNKLSAKPNVGESMLGLAVEESTAMVIQGNRLDVVGRNNAHIFLKSNGGRSVEWNEIHAGEFAQLRLDQSGKIHLLNAHVKTQH